MRTILPDQAPEFAAAEILGAARRLPLVAVTTDFDTGEPRVDAEDLARRLGDRAEVVLIETGDATWSLAAALPERLDVYGGAVRVWWPGTTRDSKPEDHPLLFVRHPGDGSRVVDRIVRMIRGDAPPPPREEPVVRAEVVAVGGDGVTLRAEGVRGPIIDADLPPQRLARHLVVGLCVPARRVPGGFSVRGLLPSPWARVAQAYKIGSVVRGRVLGVEHFGAFVEILPGVQGLVRIAEIDWSFVRDPAEFVRPGEVVTVEILSLDPDERKCLLSLKRAYGRDPEPAISLVEGGPLFDPRSARRTDPEEHAERAELEQEFEAAEEDRARLLERVRELREQVDALRKELRSTQDRHEAELRRLGAGDDPTSSERAFLAAVRTAYARAFGEADRQRYPLKPMRVGKEFLEQLRKLEGVSVDKVVEVCMQVAAGKVHEIASRDVHQLRSSDAGNAPTRIRARDGAKAWRCALQVNTPSARRLHWWSIPGEEGGAVEFASVGVHDDTSIPA